MDAKLRVILFAHPRSGSSSLYQILQLHPALNILEEPFNENFIRWHPDNKDYLSRIHDRASLDAQLAEIFTTYNGLKVLDYQLDDDLVTHLLHRADCKIVFLRRHNLLQSVVSVLIAQQTGLWKMWDQTKPLADYYRTLASLDIDDIQRRVADLKRHLDFCEAVVDARSDGAIKLVYEDLYYAPAAQRDQQITALWRFLGLDPLVSDKVQYYLQPETVKMNSAATYAWLPNAREIEQHCGNAVTGWLYELIATV